MVGRTNWWILAFCLASLSLGACEENIAAPFILHDGERHYLRVDDDEFTFSTVSADSATVHGLLEERGIEVRSLRHLSPANFQPHWLVEVERPTNITKLAQELWIRDEILFAAPVYHDEDGGRIEYINELWVAPHADVLESEVLEMADDFGLMTLYVYDRPSPKEYTLALPVDAEIPAVDLVVQIVQQPEVRRASLDLMGYVEP